MGHAVGIDVEETGTAGLEKNNADATRSSAKSQVPSLRCPSLRCQRLEVSAVDESPSLRCQRLEVSAVDESALVVDFAPWGMVLGDGARVLKPRGEAAPETAQAFSRPGRL
jgi:hypothetical protein